MMSRLLATLLLALVLATACPAAAQIVTTPRVINNPTFTGAAKFADGTAAAPSRTYTSDTDLGTYRIGANNEGFTAGGVLRFDYDTTRLALSAGYQITAGANTLIGTTADKLNAVHLAIASQAIGDLLYADSSTTFARRAAVATGQVFTSAGVGAAPAWSPIFTSTQGTITTSQPFINHTATWNDAAVTFQNDLSNVTNTASAAASTVIDRQVGGTSMFKVTRAGALSAADSLTIGTAAAVSGQLQFTSAGEIRSPTNFGINFGGSALFIFESGLFKPATTNLQDLGSTGLAFKSLHLTGALNLQAATNQIVLDSDAAVNTGTITMAALTGARTWTFPDATGTITALGNTSTGSGSVVLATSPTLTTPAIGAATGTSVTLSGLTASSFLYSGVAGLLTTTAAPTNGQILIGSTGAAPVAAAITAGTNITVTNAAGAITIAATGGGATYCRDVITAEVVNTTTETTVFTCTVTANDLSTNVMLELSLIGDVLANAGADTLTVRVKFGATTIFASPAVAPAADPGRRGLEVFVELSANNATNAQVARGWWTLGSASTNAGVGSSTNRHDFATHTSIAEDSTVNKDLIVTFQWSAASANLSAKAFTVQVKKI